jgi:hypothetical protein
MLASNGDDNTMTGCGDGEQRVWRRPVEAGGGESVWRVEERVQEAGRMLLYEQAAAAFPDRRKEIRS